MAVCFCRETTNPQKNTRAARQVPFMLLGVVFYPLWGVTPKKHRTMAYNTPCCCPNKINTTQEIFQKEFWFSFATRVLYSVEKGLIF